MMYQHVVPPVGAKWLCSCGQCMAQRRKAKNRRKRERENAGLAPIAPCAWHQTDHVAPDGSHYRQYEKRRLALLKAKGRK